MPENLQDRFQRRIFSWYFLQKTAKILDGRTGSEQGLECYLAGFYNYRVAIPMMGAAICRRTERAAENFNFPDLARELLDLYPTAASYWIGKIKAISSTTVSDLFERIPTDWIDLASKEFAIDLLEFNRQQLTSMIVNFKPKE